MVISLIGDSTNGHPNFEYSFHLTLFNKDTNSIVIENTVLKRSLHIAPNVIFKRRITQYNEYKSSMILYISDLTHYVRGQPMLELLLDVSMSFDQSLPYTLWQQQKIPITFVETEGHISSQRRVEVNLPPFNQMALSFNLQRMQ